MYQRQGGNTIKHKVNTNKNITMSDLDYKVISSGSKGNAVRINDILIDCGIPFSKLKEEVKKCKTLLITHRHSDHLNVNTYNKIRKMYPRITVASNYDVAYKVNIPNVLVPSKKYKINNTFITPFEGAHSVPVFGFIIHYKNINVLYATDTYSLKNCPNVPIDYFFLESNHDEKKLNAVKLSDYRYDVYRASKMHLSTQQAKVFYYMHRRSKDSPWIELHKSERFY